MGVVQNIIGMVRDIKDRERTSKINDILKANPNYLNDPAAAMALAPQLNEIDPASAMQFSDAAVARGTSQTAAKRATGAANLGVLRTALRGMPEGTDYEAAFDQMGPAFEALGADPAQLAGFRSAVKQNPNLLLDDKAFEDWNKGNTTTVVGTPGSHLWRGGKQIDAVPFAVKTVNTPAGAASTAFDPNTGRFITDAPGGAPAGAGAGGPLTVERLAPIFAAQESNFDYTAVNAETGALGKYQIMPDTGKVLARRAGLPWRPDMMRKNDQASRNYQDKLGNAAIQESIDYSGGDPAKLFSHYYGGSNQKQWGPKTRRYTQEMLARLGNDGGAAITPAPGGVRISPTSVVVPPKPAAGGKTSQVLTAAEVASMGLPVGTVAQRDSTGKVSILDKVPAANRPKPYDFEKARTGADKLGLFVTDAEDLLNDAGLDTAVGFVQGRLPDMMVGQGGTTWRNKLTSFKSNIGLAQLMEAKGQSSQGASGFGNLSNAEGTRLEQAFGTLETTNDENTIRENLKTIIDVSRRANERIRWQMDQADAGLPYRVPAVGTERNGFKFLGGSPANRDNWMPVRRGK